MQQRYAALRSRKWGTRGTACACFVMPSDKCAAKNIQEVRPGSGSRSLASPVTQVPLCCVPHPASVQCAGSTAQLGAVKWRPRLTEGLAFGTPGRAGAQRVLPAP